MCVPPRGAFLCKVFERQGIGLDLGSGSSLSSGLKRRVKGEGPAFGRAFSVFLSTFNSTGLSETKVPVWRDLFLACRWLILGCLLGLLRGF
jgi:hypothetical protein